MFALFLHLLETAVDIIFDKKLRSRKSLFAIFLLNLQKICFVWGMNSDHIDQLTLENPESSSDPLRCQI